MPSFKEIVDKYKKKQSTTLMDSIAVGLSLADEVSVDLGLLGDSGLLDDALNVASFGLPLAVIAVTEGSRVLLGRKTGTAAVQDSAYRAAKTGAAMSAGALVAGLGAGALPAIPVAIGVRVLMDKYRSQAMAGRRVEQRIKRLRALRTRGESAAPIWEALPEGSAQAVKQPLFV